MTPTENILKLASRLFTVEAEELDKCAAGYLLRELVADRDRIVEALRLALVAIAGAGLCTPVEGYTKAPGPGWLAKDIGELKRQRDEARAGEEWLKQQPVVHVHGAERISNLEAANASLTAEIAKLGNAKALEDKCYGDLLRSSQEYIEKLEAKLATVEACLSEVDAHYKQAGPRTRENIDRNIPSFQTWRALRQGDPDAESRSVPDEAPPRE